MGQTLFEDFAEELTDECIRDSPISRADKLLRKLKEARGWAQASIATAQEVQERNTNRYLIQAPSFQVRDQVWLSVENIRTDRPSKKLDTKYAKFTVQEVIGSHNYRLDTPPAVHNVFPSRLLRPVKSSRLPGQAVTDSRPSAQMIGGELKYDVDEILDEKKGKGRGEA